MSIDPRRSVDLPASGFAGASRDYVPALDGLRAVSIGMVLVSHLAIYGGAASLVRGAGNASGSAGVTVFFVISGYLITTLLLVEERATGGISLRGFYARRALRIFPAYYTYLAVLVGLTLVGLVPRAPLHDFLSSAVYLRNFIGRGHETAHFWSLAVEEHFYLFWPSFLILIPNRHRLRATLGLIAAVCVWRSVLVLTGNATVGALYVRTDLRVDSILVGCVLALLLVRSGGAPLFRHHARSALLAAAALGGWSMFAFRVPYADAVATTVSAALIGIVVHHVVTAPEGGASRVLSLGPMRAMGRLSYSLYLWQQLFMGPVVADAALTGLRRFPLDLALTFAAAAASYFLVEKPFLRLKKRFAPRAPAGKSTIRRADPVRAGAAP